MTDDRVRGSTQFQRRATLPDQTVRVYNHLAVSHTNSRQTVLTDLTDLIEQLRVADEWPEPDLLQAILDRAEAAIEPLRAIIQAAKNSWPTLFAARLLASLNAQSAVPDLVNLYRDLDGDILDFLLGPVALLGRPSSPRPWWWRK